jgi:hypothetical protein
MMLRVKLGILPKRRTTPTIFKLKMRIAAGSVAGVTIEL